MNTTRTVQLWLDNEEGSYREAVRLAEEALQVACDNCGHVQEARYDAQNKLASDLREMLDASYPELFGMWADLLRAAYNDIDFDDLAEHYLADLAIWAVHSSEFEDATLFTDLSGAQDYLVDVLGLDSDNTMHAGLFMKVAKPVSGDTFPSPDGAGLVYTLEKG